MKKVALIVGHSKLRQGASNKDSGITEFQFNDSLAKLIGFELEKVNIPYTIVYRTFYKLLPMQVNKTKASLAISLHCNAFNEMASGSETLYWHRSLSGQHVANVLQSNVVGVLGLMNRGTKPKRLVDRGGFILKWTKMPCVISEPFFIDRDRDLKKAMYNKHELVMAHVRTIEMVLPSLS